MATTTKHKPYCVPEAQIPQRSVTPSEKNFPTSRKHSRKVRIRFQVLPLSAETCEPSHRENRLHKYNTPAKNNIEYIYIYTLLNIVFAAQPLLLLIKKPQSILTFKMPFLMPSTI